MVKLTPAMEKFILHWGEMGARWGTNRTVAQIHALLFISPEPLNAEQIAETLSIARSNVSTSLKELQGWGIIKVVNVLGDRRDYFEALKDVWEVFFIVLEERKKREIDPTLSVLRECVMDASEEQGDKYTEEKLNELLRFMEQTTGWYGQMKVMPRPVMMKLIGLGGRIGQIIEKVSGK